MPASPPLPHDDFTTSQQCNQLHQCTFNKETTAQGWSTKSTESKSSKNKNNWMTNNRKYVHKQAKMESQRNVIYRKNEKK